MISQHVLCWVINKRGGTEQGTALKGLTRPGNQQGLDRRASVYVYCVRLDTQPYAEGDLFAPYERYGK